MAGPRRRPPVGRLLTGGDRRPDREIAAPSPFSELTSTLDRASSRRALDVFGHERGAFTGALTRKVGRFELANRGTLFPDEVGDLPLELQAKLLKIGRQVGPLTRSSASAAVPDRGPRPGAAGIVPPRARFRALPSSRHSPNM